jgi:predicted acyltransferase
MILGEVHMYKGEGITFDPEGLASTIPAIVQVIFGYLVGEYILKKSSSTDDIGKSVDDRWRRIDDSINSADDKGQMTDDIYYRNRAPLQTTNNKRQTLYHVLTGLFISSMGFLFAGYVWGLNFPINKKIWTSSYVVLTTGMAIAILATLIYAIEVKDIRGWWTRFFDVFGKNALFVFALSAFLPKGLRLIRIPNGVSDAGKPLYVSPWNWLYEKLFKFVPGAPEIGSLLFALTIILFMWVICYWMDKKRIYIKV